MGIIRSVLTADTDEIAVIRSAFDARSTGEAVIKEIRATLSKPVPGWAMKLDDETVLTVESLDSLDAALTARLALLESYPEGAKRNTALERHRLAQDVVTRLHDTLTGDNRSDNGGDQSAGDDDGGDDDGGDDSADNHNGHHAADHNDVAVGVG